MMGRCGAASERPNMTGIYLLLLTGAYARPFAFVYDASMFFFLVLPLEFPPSLRVFYHPGPIHPYHFFNPAKDYPVHSNGYLPAAVGRSTFPRSDFLRTSGISQDSPVYISRMPVDGVGSPLEDLASYLPLARHSRRRKHEEKRNRTRMSRKIPHILSRLAPGLLQPFLEQPTPLTHTPRTFYTESDPSF